jgi:hypothetical protein
VEEELTRTGAGPSFVEDEFEAAAGTGTACDGSASVQSTLWMYEKEDGEREMLRQRTLREGQATGRQQ